MTRSSALAPNLAILCSTVLWGTLWIPLRRMHETGLSGSSATTAGFLLPLVLLLPFALGRWRRAVTGAWNLGVSGFWLALSIALYSQALVSGHVARVILLFYLTPVWSTLLARFLLSEPITARRMVTILLGLAGVLVIFGASTGIPAPRGAAEWMGLASGFAWGVAMVSVDRAPSRPLFDRVFVQFVFLGPVFLLVTLIPGAGGRASLEVRPLLDSAPWLLAFALVWMLPVIGLTVFGASRLDPGRVAIFLILEIAVGLTTAALLAGEPFGLRELVGAALILSASGAEASAGRAPSAEVAWGAR